MAPRIYIVGGPGSGKTTLAEALADRVAMAALRIVRRHIRADLAGTNAFSGYRRLYRFLRSVRQRYARTPDDVGEQWTRAAIVAAAERHHGKVVRITGGSPARNLDAVLG